MVSVFAPRSELAEQSTVLITQLAAVVEPRLMRRIPLARSRHKTQSVSSCCLVCGFHFWSRHSLLLLWSRHSIFPIGTLAPSFGRTDHPESDSQTSP